MTRGGGQRWARMRHSETGHEHEVPENPGVVPMFEERGWQVVESGIIRSRESRHERSTDIVLVITCGRRGDPGHGEQLLVRAGLDPQRPERHVQGVWQTEARDDGFLYWPDRGARTDSECPVANCQTHVTYTAETLRRYLEVLRRHYGGRPVTRRVEYRDLARDPARFLLT